MKDSIFGLLFCVFLVQSSYAKTINVGKSILYLQDSVYALESTINTSVDDFSIMDQALWHAADGWTNDSPFDNGWRDDHVTFDSGSLILSLNDQPCVSNVENCSKKDYASGELRSNDTYLYGMISSSLKAAAGDGVITGLFTFAGKPGEKTHHEIDIEILGKYTNQVHFNYFVGGVGLHEKIVDLGFDASQGFHEYAFKWSPNGIFWFIDGHLVHSVTEGALPSVGGKIMLNLWAADATASDWAGTYSGNPVNAQFDWIRFTKKTE